ncbi:MAG: serine/threonine-protein kinase, partial [Bradymonadaceae bacterium]
MADAPSNTDEQALKRQVEQRVGSTIDGVGVLEDVVGIGGMATVYKIDDGSSEPRAVKLMHEHLADKGTLRKRFLREAKILDQVDHPNAVTVYNHGRATGGEAYFVMELLDGWEVETVWKKKDRELPVAEALEIAMQALDALHAYHEAEVLHRDLKPSNLFLTKTGTVKLIDFGVARFHDDDQDDSERTRSGTALGTPAYMAPEQAMGKVDKLDRRTDVYEIGAVLFTLLSGRRVHEADSNDETLVMAATQPAESVARFAPNLPTEAVQLIDKALSWDQQDRFASAEQMRLAISDLLDDDQQLERKEKVSEEEVEEAEEAVEEDVADVIVDITEESIEGMKVMFERIDQMLHSARIYKWEHDKTRQQGQAAFEAFRDIMDLEAGECYWRIRPHSFEINGEVLWNPEEPFDMIPYNLFLDGFRQIQLRSSLTPREMTRFAEWLTLDPEYDLPQEDDLATVLWDSNLPSVDANLVSTPAVIDPDSDDLLQAQTQDLMEDAESFLDEDGAGKQLLLAMRSGAYAEAEALTGAGEHEISGNLGQDFTLTPKGLIDPERVDEMSRGLEPGNQNWKRRVELIVTELWTDTTDPLEDPEFVDSIYQLVDHYLAIRRLRPLLRILIRIYSQLDTPEQRRQFIDSLFDEDIVTRLSAAVREETTPGIETLSTGGANLFGDAADDDEDAIDQKLLKMFGRALNFLPESYYQIILNDFVGASPEFRKTIAKYLLRYVTGHERQLADLFDALDETGIKMLIRIVADAGTEPAFEVLTEVLHDSGDVELRTRALKLLAEKFDLTKERFDLSSDLTELLEDPLPQMRLSSLKLARERGLSQVASSVADRATSTIYHGLPMEERRAILQTLMSLDDQAAKQVCIQLATN